MSFPDGREDQHELRISISTYEGLESAMGKPGVADHSTQRATPQPLNLPGADLQFPGRLRLPD
jgi:hypothetical protein